MKTLNITLVLSLYSVAVLGQQKSLGRAPALPPGNAIYGAGFETIGGQDKYWAEKLFEEEYMSEKCRRFKGKILMVGEDTFVYNGKMVVIYDTSKELLAVAKKGIFYTAILSVEHLAEMPLRKLNGELVYPKRQPVDAKQEDIRLVNPFFGDTVWVSNFTELKFLSTSPKIKRFSFWVHEKLMANPTIYFLELTNNNATDKTDKINFVNNSKPTFFRRGWLII